MENEIIANIVAKDYKAAAVFKKYNVDFCCGGKITLNEACRQKNINKEELIRELQEVQINELENNRIEVLELDALANHIVDTHHTYARKRITEIKPFLTKIVHVHGKAHPELNEVQVLFNGVVEELASHMQKEETDLFPNIKKMVHAKKEDKRLTMPPTESIQNTIQIMEQEHELAGNGFKNIRKITNNLTPPENACNTYRVTFSMLNEFENDLHRHLHLENNILFPKAIALEKEIAL